MIDIELNLDLSSTFSVIEALIQKIAEVWF